MSKFIFILYVLYALSWAVGCRSNVAEIKMTLGKDGIVRGYVDNAEGRTEITLDAE